MKHVLANHGKQAVFSTNQEQSMFDFAGYFPALGAGGALFD